ncbi:MAG: hypothetical protein ACFE9V_08425 [Candidatus Hodarchaeota archaeon]
MTRSQFGIKLRLHTIIFPRECTQLRSQERLLVGVLMIGEID